jgi:casein kinase II subunit beta
MYSDESDTTSSEENWTSWFCGLTGNTFFCDVEKAYIEDTFNLYGLKQFVDKNFNKALDNILDKTGADDIESEELARSTALLYGLIHARYIVTQRGLESMQRKYINKDFGECPRTMCFGQAVIPMGTTDEPHQDIVKLFCPHCRDIYNCHPNQRRK